MIRTTYNKPNLSELKNSLINSCGTVKDTDILLTEYEKFLFLIKKYPSLKAVPTKSIDTIWHYHLNDKELYAKDCISYFGHIIPHKEASSKDEVIELKKYYNLTNKLWLLNFNTPLGDTSEMAICGVDGGDEGGDNGGGHGGNDY